MAKHATDRKPHSSSAYMRFMRGYIPRFNRTVDVVVMVYRSDVADMPIDSLQSQIGQMS